MDLDKMDERIKKAEEETRESARREKSLREITSDWKEKNAKFNQLNPQTGQQN